MVSRGEVWWADLGEPRGSAPALRRPVVVVSADGYNASRLQTVIVVVLTRTRRLAALPGNVTIPADASRLPDDSVANVTQLATVDREALETRTALLPQWLLDQLDDGLRRVLALR
jgi:mRNA interferase MazF